MREKPNILDVVEAVREATDIQEVGVGGYKCVYKATVNNNTEALKLVVIPSDINDTTVRDENLRRIRREIGILEKCDTPYLVKLGSILPKECTIGGNDYLVYSEEYISGNSLRHFITGDEKPTIHELALLATALLVAVRELSGKDIIHRDIKPDNIIKTDVQSRSYVLLDLGIAFHVGGTQLTRDSTRIPGTLYYIAPEMLESEFRQNLDYRADLYAIGLTLYEYASHDNPFAHKSDPQFTTLYRIKTENPKPLKSLRSDLPEEFCSLVDLLMKKLPALRPSNIAMLIKKMEEYK